VIEKIAYLTIDDSPTRYTDELTDWLATRGIPAVLFCIGSTYTDLHVDGEGMEQNPEPIVRAIQKGFHVGNHLWSHRRASELTLEVIIEEIEKTEGLIDKLYRRSGKTRPAKLLRFPYIDRGTGGWIVDYSAMGPHRDYVTKMFSSGLNITLEPPSQRLIDKKHALQDYLKREGFRTDVYDGVTFDWYTNTEMVQARDHLCTFSTSDWMLNPAFARYNPDWTYHSVDDIKAAMNKDPCLNDPSSAHIIIAHDHDGLTGVTTALVRHLLDRNYRFSGFQL
jgi:peptidoglycan-N-acetylglucosamine deacetylase